MLTWTITELAVFQIQSFLECLKDLREVTLTPEEAGRVFNARLFAEGTYTRVAVTPDQVVIGTVSVHLLRKYYGPRVVAAQVEDLVVRKEFQGQGVGRALLLHALEIARAAGAYKLVLACTAEVAPFYERVLEGWGREVSLQIRLNESRART